MTFQTRNKKFVIPVIFILIWVLTTAAAFPGDYLVSPGAPNLAPTGTDILAGEQALSEVSIDVNPTNEDNLVIIGHQSGFDNMSTFYTMDGGLTWNYVPLGNAEDGLISGFRFDPSLAFDDNGNVYVAYGIQTNPGTGNQTTLVVGTSTDGGLNYTFTQIATNADLSVPGNDKWHLATGPAPGNPAQQNVYISWTQNISEGGGTDQRIVVSASTDGGATFSVPVIINDGSIAGTDANNLFADPAVGPNGELYVAWHDLSPNDDILFDVSFDGGTTWGTDVTITSSSAGFKNSIPAQPDRGMHTGPTIDTDRSGGAFDGRIYLTYVDLGAGGPDDGDIFVRYSDDDGGTWSAPVLVNDDGGTNSQFLPWLDVDQQKGMVTVNWYDARSDANNKKVEVWMAASGDGGATFVPNLLVSDAASDMSVDNTARYLGNFLEYIGIATLNCTSVPVWADNSEDGGDLDYYVDIVMPEVPGVCTTPTADANGPYTTVEGTDVTLDGTGSFDPDGDPLTYEWDFDGDGFDDATGPTPTFDLVGQDGLFTVCLRVTDTTGRSDEDCTTVDVANVPPSIVGLTSDAPVDEGSTVTVSGMVTDPGWLDPLTATVDWGDGNPAETIVGVLENMRPDATLTFSVPHIYGDNGDFTVTVCGSDDDTTTCDSIVVQVDNVDPTSEIDETDAVLVNGIPTFLAHAGEDIDFSGRSTDPGSDDLHLSWDWGDGPPSPDVTTIYLVNPPNPDPFPSPSIQPRDVTDMQTHAFDDACIYEISFMALDDDGGSSSDQAVVLITANGDKTRSEGYWQHQFRRNGKTDFTDEELECYLLIVDYVSNVFNEERDASTIEAAHDVLFLKGNGGSAAEQFDRELLRTWLNFANGALEYNQLVDTDKDGTPDTELSMVIAAAEAVRLNPASTDKELREQTQILHLLNNK